MITTLISVAKNVGANRIILGAGVPHVLGNPQLKPELEKNLRSNIVEEALNLLAAPTKNELETDQPTYRNGISSL